MVIGCGGGDDSAIIDEPLLLSPENVVEKAIQAQFNGDIDTFLANCALEGATDEQTVKNREQLNVIKDNTTLAEFVFTSLATGIYEENVSIVRAITSYTVNGINVKNGLLIYLKKENKEWKIVKIVPDEFLNQQIYEDALLTTKNEKSDKPPSLSVLNEELNAWIKKDQGIKFDAYNKIREATFTAIGTIPITGDTIANIEQLCGIAENTNALINSCAKHGTFTPVAAAKLKEIAIGGLRILTEFVPGADTGTDLLGMEASNMSHNIERTMAKHELQRVFRGVSIKETGLNLRPYISNEPNYPYPDGLLVFRDDVASRDFPTLVEINVSKAEWLGLAVPFNVYGYLEFDIKEGLIFKETTVQAQIAINLGGEIVGDIVRLAIDLNEIVDGIADTVIGLPDEYPVLNSAPLPGIITCYQGNADFYVTLSNDMRTASIPVTTIINDISTLTIQTGTKDIEDEDVLNLYLGNNAENNGADKANKLKVLAKINAENIDLASIPNCLDVRIEDPDIALFEKGDALTSITGIKTGETFMYASLGNGGDLHDSVKVIVQEPLFVNLYHGTITSVINSDPDDYICMEGPYDDGSYIDAYALEDEMGNLFSLDDEALPPIIGKVSDGQLQVEIDGDTFDGTPFLGNWHDGNSCSGTYRGEYLSLTALKSLVSSCDGEAVKSCDLVEQLIAYKESFL